MSSTDTKPTAAPEPPHVDEHGGHDHGHVHGPDCNHGHAHHHSPMTPIVRAARKVGRNDPCPCGSGKKYKKCCLSAA